MNIQEPKCPLSQERILVTPEFRDRNHLFLVRSQSEILSRLDNPADFFGFASEVLLDYLPFDAIKHKLKSENICKYESGEETWIYIDRIEVCAQDFLDYMNFAWGKAENQRGISASRSIQKLSEWLWLMGRDDLYSILQNEDLYNPYGAPALIEVCDKMEIPVPESLIEFAKHKCH